MPGPKFRVVESSLPGVRLIEPRVHADERGFLMETWTHEAFAAEGLPTHFEQENHSRSARGVLRGLHYQLAPGQGKLVRVTAGAAFDVAVDLRRGSASFGRWASFILSAENRCMAWIPAGFAHGFLALEAVDVIYKCTTSYRPEDERVIAWDDPLLAIDWPLGGAAPILSPRDRQAGSFADAEPFP